MRRFGAFAILAFTMLLATGGAAWAQEKVRFLSSHDNGAGRSPTTLDGYLFRAKTPGRHPAVVFLHDCYGMFDAPNVISAVQRQWADKLNADGDDVLMVDSNTPRGIKENCSVKTFQLPLYLRRINDAYGALDYLQSRDFIRPDAIGLMGWGAGGGVVFLTIAKNSVGRPDALPKGDFRAGVGMYPALCSNKYFVKPWADTDRPTWTSPVPMLILDGGKDVWTPARQCHEFVAGANARGAKLELRIYANAYHAFDAPNLKPIKFPAYAQPDNVTPILGTNPAARADALKRVPAFFAKYLAGQ